MLYQNIWILKYNKFYRLYKRIKAKPDIIEKYVIYRTKEYGGDLFKQCNTLKEANKIFKIATKEALTYEKTMF